MKLNAKDFLGRFSPAMMFKSKSSIGSELVNLVRITPHTPGILVESKDYEGEMRIYGEVIQPPKDGFCVDGVDFYNAIKLLSGEVSISRSGKHIEISCGGFSCKLPSFPATDLPPVCENVPDELSIETIDGKDFAKAFSTAVGFVSDETMSVFNNAFFAGDSAIGTDRVVFSKINVAVVKAPFSLSSAMNDRVVRFCEIAGEVSITVGAEKIAIAGHDGETMFICNQNYGIGSGQKDIDGYMAAVSKLDISSEFEVSAATLKNAIVRVNSVANTTGIINSDVLLTVHKDKLVVGCSGDHQADETMTIVPIKTDDSCSFFLVPRLAVKGIMAHGNSIVRCKISQREKSPLIITSPGIETHVAQTRGGRNG